MLKSKKWLVIIIAAVMILSLTACGGGSDADSNDTATADPNEAAAEDEANLSDWESSSGIFNTDETDEELYELAKEEGSVTIYSISSRVTKVASAFMEKYPDIEVEFFDISTDELLEKVTREYDAGQHVADVVHIKDQDGSMYNEYVMSGTFYNYKPADILSHIDPEYTETATPLYIELTQLFYNSEAYPDGPPITNIWEVTMPEWKGRLMMQNPLDNLSWGSWITGFCVGETPDQLAQAYKDLTGEELVLSDGCENAGYEFLKRLHDNEPIYTSSSDEIAESVGTKGQSSPPIGFCASSKVRKNADNDWCLEPINLEPTTGIPAINTLYVVEGCQHPNAAKLLIRFMMGGIDGDLSGFENFNTLGGWPVRDDIEPEEGSTPYEDVNVSDFDPDEIYENINIVRDFWTLLG
ncbi:MAG: extracellular solute-binding protein [Lachnospiraceae bacterium]